MAKDKTEFVCDECGYNTTNWMGRCTSCGAWNTLREVSQEERDVVRSDQNQNLSGIAEPIPVTEIGNRERFRFSTTIEEFDRVLGGGIVQGSLVLFGGAPGIGKSTLMLQTAYLFCLEYGKVLYVSGEESSRQIKLRAERLNTLNDNLLIAAETNYEKIEGTICNGDYSLIIVDSIQTIYGGNADSTPGSISQIKEVSSRLQKVAKKLEIPVFLIGHITKKGDLAGPRVLEHLVDTVLKLEGDRNHRYRLLRTAKNRYGSTREMGVFRMESSGIKEVKNPSRLFLEGRPKGEPGSVIVPVIEGSRTILVEVQALISGAAFSAPQRVTTGLDNKRVSILLAVLEKKLGFNFRDQDVHLNITGGITVKEPALDLGIITAVISSYRDSALEPDVAVVGEVGLTGEVRGISRIEMRIKELRKMGFKNIILTDDNLRDLESTTSIDMIGIRKISEVVDILF
ncbi:MAG: DNA repair protein RadA [Halanaerobiales bacterium]